MSRRIKRLVRIAMVAALLIGVAIQFIPVDGVASNPPARASLGAPPEVEAILRRACLDCHSNETRWPLYSRIAPGSWLMTRDVTKGRQHLNLSEWGDTDEEERKLDREHCWEMIESGEMPPWFYIYPLHLNARLSDADKATLKAWMLKSDDNEAAASPSDKDADKGAVPPAVTK